MRFRTIQHIFFLVLLLLVTMAFFGLVLDLLKPLFWAAALAILFHRTHEKFTALMRGRAALGAVLTIIVIIAIVIFPLFLVTFAVTREAVGLYERVSEGNFQALTTVIQFAEDHIPLVTYYFKKFGVDVDRIQEYLSGAAVTVGKFVASQAVIVGQNALGFGILTALMIYVLFFFLRDGSRLIKAFMRVFPLEEARERRLLEKFAEVSRATIKGVIVVAVIQGGLGGVLFWLLGIGAPVFWGMMMTAFSLLPAIGPAIVWGPAVIILLVSGEITKGFILLAGGTLVIGLVDNVLRPRLVGRDTNMPDFMILISTIGGLTVFGISGFLVGPIIAALFLTIWEMFSEVYVKEGNPEYGVDGLIGQRGNAGRKEEVLRRGIEPGDGGCDGLLSERRQL